jgi:transcriptional regulator with XRE-family HTH domain
MKTSLNQTKLGNVLKGWRESERIDQRTAAKEIGIGASTLCRLESGETTPDAKTFMAILIWLFMSK